MKNETLISLVTDKANSWLEGDYDADTKKEIQQLLDNEDKSPLIDAFYKDLEFGTGGLRGIMGAGSNRMNIYTVGTATQGLSNYLKKEFANHDQIKVVIGHDCRNNSRKFAEVAADIFSANGIKVYLFENLRPTPLISYAIRKLGCQSGIMVTASHNPKEYNGYKAYWNDGAQVLAPHDRNIIAEVNRIKSNSEIKFKGDKKLIEIIGKDMDNAFIEEVKKLVLSPESIQRNSDIKIVYTPIHGTGGTLVPDALKAVGFTNIIHVPEQDVISGDFPTVVSPNPEEPAALDLAIKKARETDADLVMATDPDSDRIGTAIRDDKGEFILVNGNQTLLLCLYYLMTRREELGLLTGKEFIVKTIVSTELAKVIAQSKGIEIYDSYTGFKWIADIIRKNEGIKKYIGGGEESYGFLAGDFVRDKDAVSACTLFAEIAAWARDNGKSVYELLQDIYLEYGYSKEVGISLVKKGKEGAEEIEAMMKNFRANPLTSLGGSPVTLIKDFGKLEAVDFVRDEQIALEMPTTSNVIQYFTEDNTKMSIRPSGTEPKIKFYIEVKGYAKTREELEQAERKADEKINEIREELGI
ncbi:MAG TPA: phospho-sugar mutase [Fermentimonas caenicola]|jgi:phosphoglucomutase|uniref:phospho-sugar mutase n=1 Tax=Lascolabacillus sp. TaxID=1924068 RepID=UPI000ACA444F|nr:phospho-sugar mutase [Lascolabacillus sp.]MBP6196244.1 phospho-sugar mutase [Fermentimonas sp.]TAH61916.1 MAG: phospho-sugar mutase [Fermentimonas caenicola]MCK9500902.1 phospho-sugar mutase [Lascolabacillus sp.]MDD3657451.1 phospho-sugar mutase [Lascolabacillus sp.]HHU41127.1 phospho-sugar mutase [Fermentimonas caenicola]